MDYRRHNLHRLSDHRFVGRPSRSLSIWHCDARGIEYSNNSSDEHAGHADKYTDANCNTNQHTIGSHEYANANLNSNEYTNRSDEHTVAADKYTNNRANQYTNADINSNTLRDTKQRANNERIAEWLKRKFELEQCQRRNHL